MSNPALTVALAMGAGILAQSVARHLKVPGIVLLLAAGAALGPEGIGVVQPALLGTALEVIVGFAVAVILFEGGMNLEVSRLKREARTIRLLITLGAAITAVGGAVSAHLILGWTWQISILFGSLIIVTGPTVVGPLLKRIKVKKKLATVLDAEGVLIDPIGAIVAVVTLELSLHHPGGAIATGLWDATVRLGAGLVFGLLGGLLLAELLKREAIVPEGLDNVFTLASVLVLFQASNAVLPESGIMSVTAAGLVVGNMKTRVQRELHEFKEQLTVLFIGMLFVLLAADVRLADVRALGTAGVLTVLCMMLVVRPIGILACTAGAGFTTREKTFLAWLAPRGIVAAAMASLFAQNLAAAEVAGGAELRALVFLVIAMTVLIQGLSGGLVARLLDVKRPAQNGFVVLGASPLSLTLGRLLRDGEHEVVFIDSNPHVCRVAEEDGFRVIYGNGLEERVLQRAEVETRAACIGLTPNSGVNLLFAHHVYAESHEPSLYVALRREGSVTPKMVAEEGYRILFSDLRDLSLWMTRFEKKTASVERWQLGETASESLTGISKGVLLPLVFTRNGTVRPVSEEHQPKPGDLIDFAIATEKKAEALAWFEEHGLTAVPVVSPTPSETAGGSL